MSFQAKLIILIIITSLIQHPHKNRQHPIKRNSQRWRTKWFSKAERKSQLFRYNYQKTRLIRRNTLTSWRCRPRKRKAGSKHSCRNMGTSTRLWTRSFMRSWTVNNDSVWTNIQQTASIRKVLSDSARTNTKSFRFSCKEISYRRYGFTRTN